MKPPTHRPLPDDPAIGALSDEVRLAVATAWRRRARNELSTSTVFATLTRSLVGLSAPRAVVRQAAEAVADEVRHAEICDHVATAYWPAAPAPEPSPVAAPLGREGGEESALASLLYVIMQSCINEGVACAYLQRGMAEATFELPRAAVRDILEDEIHHARFGWSLLTSDVMRPSWRPEVAGALPTLLGRIAEAWTQVEGRPSTSPAGHGNVLPEDMPEVLGSAYTDLILPGFDHVGIDTRAARTWLAERIRASELRT
jgi:hypothetical protein